MSSDNQHPSLLTKIKDAIVPDSKEKKAAKAAERDAQLTDNTDQTAGYTGTTAAPGMSPAAGTNNGSSIDTNTYSGTPTDGAPTMAGSAGVVSVPGNVTSPVPVGQKTFTVVEDHAVEKEKVERWVEHRPVEREYVTKVEETGKTTAQGAYADASKAQERVLGESTAFPVGTTTTEGVVGNNTAGTNVAGVDAQAAPL